jgi:hypothetical protein
MPVNQHVVRRHGFHQPEPHQQSLSHNHGTRRVPWIIPLVQGLYSERELQESIVDTTTLLIIIIVLLVLGGGFYGRGRWY